ncbi:prevent-host-death protein [Petrotoga sp. 9PW.55.5.1]|uniref:type II toxin-antitoxin system Phd/YefM family antitoxin n=1 Tax=Petrotoga sp. 9PW.55.5.1 TaxID=1308979 RepID=UPI000DC34242|nr:type II toxin-antitoxin system Phd/YefM family antitoxin [Petrotoga sp. 9PW.55.5.1]RAO98423.1 prevent-host-death protein [Petrotoga sp. 9PW.55.5.1]
MDLKDYSFYSLADAKARFSQVVDEIEEENKNIIITKNGVPKAVMMNYEKFIKLIDFIDEIRDLSLFEIEDVEEYKRIKKFFDYFED